MTTYLRLKREAGGRVVLHKRRDVQVLFESNNFRRRKIIAKIQRKCIQGKRNIQRPLTRPSFQCKRTQGSEGHWEQKGKNCVRCN